jgi:hypothetical protein
VEICSGLPTILGSTKNTTADDHRLFKTIIKQLLKEDEKASFHLVFARRPGLSETFLRLTIGIALLIKVLQQIDRLRCKQPSNTFVGMPRRVGLVTVD